MGQILFENNKIVISKGEEYKIIDMYFDENFKNISIGTDKSIPKFIVRDIYNKDGKLIEHKVLELVGE